ncbi:benzoate/H(+) symporter BenE family transporter [uncultured Paenalcaligenes sp.]|uniref:benzoate/H(+) symporter BenE family transporter n=1 Tax=uncultured Paenalcaligenes sp. TaxID=1588925 RepID=UPI0026105772|nr:benzoate/H(+) symporter BenE family transporter [uncultured Paenalcaligenes sp.]
MAKSTGQFSTFTAGLLAVIISYSSSIAIVLQAAKAAGATEAQIGSWMLALGVGIGISSIIPSLLTRTPVLMAWSTPGAALLATSLMQYNYAQSIAVFMFASLLMTLVGLSGLFYQFSRWIPAHLAAAMLAGILVHFGIGLFIAAEESWSLVLLMLISYFTVRHFSPRLAVVITLLIGVGFLFFQDSLSFSHLRWGLTAPIWQTPEWNLGALIGVGIPLFLVTLSSQNLPGVAVMQTYGYQPPMSPIIAGSGLMGVILAPFGGFAYNLAAITAALCMSPESHPEPAQRYKAAIYAGLIYLLCGVFGATLISFFLALPHALIAAISGIALIGTISQSFATAFNESSHRESALFTFLATASGISLFNIGSAFWGLVIGLIVHHLLQLKKTS